MKWISPVFMVFFLLCSVFARAASYSILQVSDTTLDDLSAQPAVTWENTNTNYPNDDDKAVVNIGFTFAFGSSSYTQVRIMTNGVLQFGSDTGFHKDYTNEALPITNNPDVGPGPSSPASLVLAAYWDDLIYDASSAVRYKLFGSAPNRYLVVSWENLPRYNTTQRTWFQAVLYENGDVRYRYDNSFSNMNGSSATIGLEVSDTDYIQHLSDSSSLVRTQDLLISRRRAFYTFDEVLWSGGASALDSSIFAYNATPNLVTQSIYGKVCKDADFDSNISTLRKITVPSAAVSGAMDYTFGTWLRISDTTNNAALFSATRSMATKGTFVVMQVNNNNSFYVYMDDDSNFMQFVNGKLSVNAWYYVAVRRTGASVTLSVYDSSATQLFSQTQTQTKGGAPRSISTNSVMIGNTDYTAQANRAWKGRIDELQFLSGYVDNATVQVMALETRPCSLVDHFVIGMDGFGIHCVNEIITVSARDASNAIYTAYTGTITLNTGTGKGDWSLQTGAGVLANGTANDGMATYAYAAGDNGQAQFSLSYKEGSSPINIAVCDNSGSPCDDNTEGTMTWAPSGFMLTASAISNPPPAVINDPILAQNAGTAFTMHLAAYGQTPTDSQCGIIENYTGSKNLKFWLGYDNPATGTLVPTVNGTVTAASQAAASNQAVTFTNGQASVSVKYKDVGSIQINARDDSSYSSASHVLSGASNLFVVRPTAFAFTEIVRASNGAANSAAASSAGAVFMPAGVAMGVTVEARDSENSRTPNYGKESPAEGLLLEHLLLQPAAGATGSLTAPSSFSTTLRDGSTLAGRFYNSSVSWNEVGIMQLRARVADGNYLGAGDVIGAYSANVGRFIPDHFSLGDNHVDTTCTGFAYMAQGFTLNHDLEAQSASNTRTQNYTGVFAKLDPASWVSNSAGAVYAPGAPVVPQNLSARLAYVSSTGSFTNGFANNVQFSVQLARAASADGPYAGLALGLAPQDSDGVALTTGQLILDINNDAAMDHALIGGANLRYGRALLDHVSGWELEPLNMRTRLQYWNGAQGFISNTLDDAACSGSFLDASDFTLVKNLAAGGNSNGSWGGLIAGIGYLTLTAPGQSHQGTVDVTLTVPAWLQYNFQGSGDENPRARATFGIWRSKPVFIFQRESFR